MDYRMRTITWNGKQTLVIEYDGRFQIEIYGTYVDAIKQANRDMDRYGYDTADIINPETGEVILTIKEEVM
jgi:hypothetical protein